MLDDTAIREFFLRDYPRLVNAEVFVSDDLREAQDTVRRSLRRAWDRDDAGSPVEPLADWVLADVMGRAGRRRRALTGRRRRATVGGVLGGLDRRGREVAALCLYLRRTPQAAAHIVGMREGELNDLLAAARTTLAGSPVFQERDRARSHRDDGELDDELERWLAHAERPVPIDGVFERTLRDRTSAERRRQAVTLVLSLALVAAVAAGFLALNRPAHVAARTPARSAPLPAPALGPPPAAAASVPGIAFPVCAATGVVSDFERVHGSQTAYVFERARHRGPCVSTNIVGAYVALAGAPRPHAVVSGPIDCFPTCHMFGAPSFAGRPAMLAVVVADGSGDGGDTIELYRARLGPTGIALDRISSAAGSRRVPVAFGWGGVGIYRMGADCLGSARTRLDIWTAVLRRGDWMVQKQTAVLHGATLGPARTVRSRVRSEASLPPGGGGEFCGARVR